MEGIYITKEFGDSVSGQKIENYICFYYILTDGSFFIRKDVMDIFGIQGESVTIERDLLGEPLKTSLEEI